VDRDDCPSVRRALRYNRQAVEETAGHGSFPASGGEVLDLGEERGLANEPAVVERFEQRIRGLASGYPAVQLPELLNCFLRQQAVPSCCPRRACAAS
jgi:hypothetical protein